MPSALQDLIVRRIREHGAIDFAEFMALALYHPEHGYYLGAAARTGRDGDFVTAPTYSPSFGRTLANLLPIVHRATGSGEILRVVDAGGGGGELLIAMSERIGVLLPGVAVEAVLLECSPARRRRGVEALAPLYAKAIGVADAGALAAIPSLPGLVVANELFDALPVRRLRRSGRRHEAMFVDVDREGALCESWREATAESAGGRRLPRGRETTIAEGVEDLMLALSRGVERGLVLVSDYGYPAPILDAPDGPGSPIRGFRSGSLVDDVLRDPGLVDLTAGVDFSRLDRAAGAAGLSRLVFCDQYSLLLGLGFLDDPDAARAKRLIHPEDMGGAFKCLLYAKGLTPEIRSAFAGVRDRSRQL